MMLNTGSSMPERIEISLFRLNVSDTYVGIHVVIPSRRLP